MSQTVKYNPDELQTYHLKLVQSTLFVSTSNHHHLRFNPKQGHCSINKNRVMGKCFGTSRAFDDVDHVIIHKKM
jgi:hypothetical protein